MYYKLSHHTTSDVTPTHSIHVHISAGPDTIYSSLPFLRLPTLIVFICTYDHLLARLSAACRNQKAFPAVPATSASPVRLVTHERLENQVRGYRQVIDQKNGANITGGCAVCVWSEL